VVKAWSDDEVALRWWRLFPQRRYQGFSRLIGRPPWLLARRDVGFSRTRCSAETWLDFVKNFHQRFRNAAGLLPSQHSFRMKLRKSSSLAS
jgi:hypothetical protein